ncbi:MAG: hydrogenase maturation protease [Cyanobacteria bacterium REEB67]|nr:hydrogenase maturation protease [Cyanobacteria bacterium REEB67]
MTISIIGCGNTNRNDDGVGVYVVGALKEALTASDAAGRYAEDVRIFDAGTAGLEVMFQARGSTSLIIIDASRSGAEAGAIFEVPGAELEKQAEPSYNMHDFRWDHALFAGRKIFKEDFPSDVKVFLIESQNLDFGLELSEVVKKSADRVVEILLERLRKPEPAASVRLTRGKIYLESPLFEKYFSGHETVALIEREGKFVLLPVFSGAQGGLMIKLINARGDRLVDAVDFFRRFNLDLENSLDCPVAWNSEMAGMVIDVPGRA